MVDANLRNTVRGNYTAKKYIFGTYLYQFIIGTLQLTSLTPKSDQSFRQLTVKPF